MSGYLRQISEVIGATASTTPDEPELGNDDRPMPCGEGHCRCYGIGYEHADHACGCDCPRDEEGDLDEW
ncbi:hypothetical protein Aph01nite_76900 [Acrocarpospora phusangensis]|uniref:Uncharacterized protein n=1 Tax=Acrocarpospora phusangensis TaxID=1070424 RepID=A0A919QN92_9ACTN|nr:hypothetical protein [Acrocarpospora phusangensis]GIH29380.1 hypothetical protein Aph01nite_76900 [Acrocarpospora phusangensis]